jgi:hypothetical protein
MTNLVKTNTEENEKEVAVKSCSYADIGNILVSAGSKAAFIDGIANIILIGAFTPPQLTIARIGVEISAAFVSYTIREYATKCADDMQYVGGIVGGLLKYGIKGSNPLIGAVNNLGYEICNFHKLDSGYCAITIETTEEVTSSMLGISGSIVSKAFFNGIIISSVIVTSADYAYVPLDKHLKAAFNFTAADANSLVPSHQSDMCFEQSYNQHIANDMIDKDICLLGDGRADI